MHGFMNVKFKILNLLTLIETVLRLLIVAPMINTRKAKF